MAQRLLTDEQLFALAPLQLYNHRTTRYRGDGVSVTLAAFAEGDAARIRRMYDALIELRALLAEPVADADAIGPTLAEFVTRTRWVDLLAELRELRSPRAPGTELALGQVIHDLRGGAFQALSVFIQLAEMGIARAEDWTRMFLLTRDHLKIMRNCIPDLDPERYEQDMRDRAHSIRLLVEKWGNSTYALPGLEADVALDCRFDGIVSERCIEFSALDRVLYNLMNNATRHAADRHVQLSIVPLPAENAPHLRFAIANRVTEEQEQALRAGFAEDVGGLFRGGFTTGGSGLGMQICAEFVANAYGLATPDAALAGGYIGATCRDERFVAFFHWPTVAD
jgi:signal transduction histidine kinase